MNKICKNQKGFTAVEGLLIILILAVIGGVGYMVYHNNHKTKTDSVSTTATTKPVASEPAKSTTVTSPYAGWSSYTSKSAGYTIKYPSGWTIEGYSNSGSSSIPATQLTGNEDSILLYNPAAKANSFGIWLNNDTKYETTANGSGGGDGADVTPYSDGSVIKTLSNGINIWSQSQSTDNSGVADFEAVTNGEFGYKLNSGAYLQLSMGFGYAYGQTTNYTYSQQVSSPLLTQAESILSSLAQN